MRLLTALLLALVVSPLAAQTTLKVYISADMEGIGGVATRLQSGSTGCRVRKVPPSHDPEVNAAIEGAFDAGATEVPVSDSHGNAQNSDLELLDKRARLIRACPRELGMVHGLDRSFAAVAFVGYHASDGQNPGILAQTFSGTLRRCHSTDARYPRVVSPGASRSDGRTV